MLTRPFTIGKLQLQEIFITRLTLALNSPLTMISQVHIANPYYRCVSYVQPLTT